MDNGFNGQINISRDLRQNKQTVFGKRDLLDIIFIVIAVAVAVLVSYVLGFYLKIIDEFSAVIIGLIPMVIILILGFKRKAGIRYAFYVLMNRISKARNFRTNKENFSEVINKEKKNIIKATKQNIKKHITLKEILNLKYLKDKILNRKIQNVEVNNNDDNIKTTSKEQYKKNNRIINKIILVLNTNTEKIDELAKEYLINDMVSRIQIRLKDDKCILLLELNYSYKEFLSIYIKNEFKTIGVKANKKETIKEFVSRMKQKLDYLFKTRRTYYTKYSKFVNFEIFNREFIPQNLYDFYDGIKSNQNLKFIEINDEYINSLDIKNKKVYMLHIYKINDYKKIVEETKSESEVVIYVIKNDGKIYVSTYFVLNKESELNLSKNMIINKLTKEQGLAISQSYYHMYNPYNNYRLYKEM